MSDRLDTQIRALFEKADEHSPDPPTTPATRFSRPRGPRWLTPAAGLAVAILVTAIGLQTVIRQSGEASGTTIVGAAATTTVVAAETTAAQGGATTTESATGTTQPGNLIFQINEACGQFVRAAGFALPDRPVDLRAARTSVSSLIEPVRVVAASVSGASADTGDSQLADLASVADAVLQGMADFVANSYSTMGDYELLRTDVGDFGERLALAGAANCIRLVGAMP